MVRTLRSQTDAGPVVQPEPALLGLSRWHLQPLSGMVLGPMAASCRTAIFARPVSRSPSTRHPGEGPRSGDSRSAHTGSPARRCPRSVPPRRPARAAPSAGWSDAGRARDRQAVPRPGTSAGHDRCRLGGGRGLVVSRGVRPWPSPLRISFSSVRSETAFRSRSFSFSSSFSRFTWSVFRPPYSLRHR